MDDSVGDPELLATADGFVLFFTARGNDLRPSVGRVDLDSALVPADMPAQVVTGALVDGEAASAATVRRSDDGTWVMVVDSSENGIRQFRALRSSDGTNWTRHHSNALETLTRRNPDSAGSAFDAEEIAHPTLTVHNGAWILHYAGRRGTRTSIGLLASDDFVDWRSPTGDAVLSPGSSAIDTVGVDAPAVIVEPEGLTIVYVAQDGYQRRLATASRRATDSGSFF
jgi:hypothetical protein